MGMPANLNRYLFEGDRGRGGRREEPVGKPLDEPVDSAVPSCPSA